MTELFVLMTTKASNQPDGSPCRNDYIYISRHNHGSAEYVDISISITLWDPPFVILLQSHVSLDMCVPDHRPHNAQLINLCNGVG